MELSFYTADVFTEKLFHGAQIAVFPNAQGVDDTQMQLIARELNLSETVFVFPPSNGMNTRRIRIFSPLSEVDFGGHPIIAAAHVLASIGEIALQQPHTAIVLEQNIGPINVNISEKDGKPVLVQFSMQTRYKVDKFVPPPGELADILSLPVDEFDTHKYASLMVSCGYPYLIVPLRRYDAVRTAKFNFRAWGQSTAPATFAREILIFSTQSESHDCDFHARLVGPHIGFDEDPPIGSSMPAFAGYLCSHEHMREGTYSFVIDRGETKTRRSILKIEMDNKETDDLTIRVGGPAVMVSEGKITIPA